MDIELNLFASPRVSERIIVGAGVEEENNYFPTLADAMGIRWSRIDNRRNKLSAFDIMSIPGNEEMKFHDAERLAEEHRLTSLEGLIEEGVKGLYVSGAVAASKSGVFPGFVGKHAVQKWMPGHGNAIRIAPLLTPLTLGWAKIKAKIIVVPDQSDAFRDTGDGRALMARAFANRFRHGLALVFEDEIREAQFRMVFGHDKAEMIKHPICKGEMGISEDVGKFGVDIVLPVSCVKGLKNYELWQIVEADVTIGFTNLTEAKWTDCSYQTHQFFSDEEWTPFRAMWPQIIESRKEICRNAENFVKSLDAEKAARPPYSTVVKLIRFAAEHQVNVLMNHPMVVRVLQTEIASQNRLLCQAGGVRGRQLRVAFRKDGQDGVARMHPEDWRSLHREALMYRSPHSHPNECVSIGRIVIDSTVPRGAVIVTEHDVAQCAGDGDGDEVYFVSPDAWWYGSRLAQAKTRNLDAKPRGGGQPHKISTLAQKLDQIQMGSIGYMANGQSDIALAFNMGLITQSEFDEMSAFAQIQIQAEVDGPKHDSFGDMRGMRAIRKALRDRGLDDRNSTNVRKLCNGQIKAWLPDKDGTIVLPSAYVDDKTSIGRNFVELGDKLPTLQVKEEGAKLFEHWLPDGAGIGAKLAEGIFRWGNTLLAEAETDDERTAAHKEFQLALKPIFEKDAEVISNFVRRMWRLAHKHNNFAALARLDDHLIKELEEIAHLLPVLMRTQEGVVIVDKATPPPEGQWAIKAFTIGETPQKLVLQKDATMLSVRLRESSLPVKGKGIATFKKLTTQTSGFELVREE